MNVAIVKYNAGNIYSVVNAIKRLGITPILTDSADELQNADKVIFPGQGNALEAMTYLKAHGLDKVIKNLRQPVLGICVGQQLLCRHSEEGDVDCIGIFDVDVKKFQPTQHEDKVPAMGWEEIYMSDEKDDAAKILLKDLGKQPYVYFVHSYYVPVCENTIATADYIIPYSACMHKGNFYTCQFHPEKSGDVGEQILKNFLNM